MLLILEAVRKKTVSRQCWSLNILGVFVCQCYSDVSLVKSWVEEFCWVFFSRSE